MKLLPCPYRSFVPFILLCVSLPAHPLESIIVSGSRFRTESWQIPSQVSVITAEDIAISGADHVIDVLGSTAGLQVSDLFGDGSDAYVGLRGFAGTAAQNTLVMVDGRRLNNADISLPDLNAVSIENIEKLEVVKGSMGTLFGDKAVGGVINIITRKPERPGIRLKAEYGSFNQRSLYAAVENSHANGLNYRLGIGRNLDNNFRENNARRITDVSSRAGFEHAEGEVFAEYQGISEVNGLPGALFSDMLAEDRRQALNPDDGIRSRTDSGRLGIRYSITDRIEMLAEYTNRFNNVRGTLSSAGNPQQFSSKRHHLEFTPRIVTRMDLPAGEALLTLGADWFVTDYLIVSNFGITDDTQQQTGWYARLSLPVQENLTLTAGGRLGRVKNDILVDTINFGRSLPAGSEIDDTANAWELGAVYRLNANWRIFSKYDRNFRFVTADEYSAIADNNFFAALFRAGETVPLPVTQTGYSLELGTDWQSGNDYASVQVYRLEIDNEITFDPGLFLNTNAGDTRRLGMIAEGRYNVNDRLSLSANYAYIDARYTDGPYAGNDLSFLARHSGGVSAGYRVSPALQTWIEWQATSPRPFEGDFTNEFERLQGYAVVNLHAAFRSGDFRFSLRVNNLLDKTYSDAGILAFDFRQPFPSPRVETWYPSPGRHILFGMEYRYE